MTHSIRILLALFAVIALLLSPGGRGQLAAALPELRQQSPAQLQTSRSASFSSGRSVPLVRPQSPFRQLAPGVLREVAIEKNVNDTYSRHDVVELLKVNPGYSWAKDIRFDHAIWCLEFAYKPIRFVDADAKTVWYLVYRIKNPGAEPVSFYPWFVLESKDPKIQKAYPDRLLPAAISAIMAREDRNRPLLNTVAISGEIPPGREVWGVATWSDIDPRIDRFSIYISGLTNAYRWRDDPQQGRTFLRKTLELNFWRPGDEYYTHETEIRPGGPDGQVDHQWVYR